jgi:hypothetical protein
MMKNMIVNFTIFAALILVCVAILCVENARAAVYSGRWDSSFGLIEV